MTRPDNDSPNRAHELEDIVDQLDEKVAREREAEGVAGNRSDRERAATTVPKTSRRTSVYAPRQASIVSSSEK